MGGQRIFLLWRSAAWIAAVSVFLSVLVSLPVASGQAISAVWLATHTAVYRVDTATNSIAAALPLPQEAEAVAVDATLGSVWVLAHKRLYRFDAATTGLVAEFDLKRLSSRLEDPSRLLLNPYDGSLWVAGEKSLLHIDSLGRVLLEWQASEKITAIAVALDESLWLTTKKELLQLTVSGTVLVRVSLTGLVNESRTIAVDSVGSILWLADDKTLLKLNFKDLGQPPSAVYRVKGEEKGKDEDSNIAQLSLDPLDGRLWLATKTQILGFDRAGAQFATATLPADLKKTETLLYDNASQSLWLGTKKQLVRLNGNGTVLVRLDIDNELKAAAVAPFQLVPQLSLLAPSDELLTNNPRPAIRLGLSALCQDMPCTPAASYFGSFNLNAALNGNPVGNLFGLSGTEAAYTPGERLPEGPNVFNAQATDAFAHLSNSVQARFTVDTIPPKFLNLTPVDGSVVNTQPVTVSGSLDDPTATVMLENMALLGASVADGNPQQFSFTAPLKDGLNTFVLIARDPAGNEARTTLNLTYSTVSVNVINITQSMMVNTDRLLVMGIFRGPPNTGVTVNSVVAETYGDKFYVNNFPLNPGENTLIVVATTPDRQTATQTLTVSSMNTARIFVERTQGALSIIDTVAGTGVGGYSGDDGPATYAYFNSPSRIAIGPDGSIYIPDTYNYRIRRIGPDRIVTTVAGTGWRGSYGDGGPATQAGLAAPRGVALGPDGSLYIADTSNKRVRRVQPDGIITTVAGNGSFGFSGDGGPATTAQLSPIDSVAVGTDGSIYIADTWNRRIRKVDSAGIITTVAGGGNPPDSLGDGLPATEASLGTVLDVALAPDGGFYLLEENRVRKVGPDGRIATVAGNGSFGFSGDGGPAIQAQLSYASGITISPKGELYIAEGNNRVRRVGQNGIITTVAGTGMPGYSGDGGEADRARLSYPYDVAIGSDGSIYVAERVNHAIRRIQSFNTSGGNAPVTVQFMIVNNTGNAIQKIEADFDGNGSTDFTTANPDAPIYYMYQSPGAYLAKFTVTDSQNNIYTHTYAVVLSDPQQMDQVFKTIWGGMNTTLTKGDVTAAAKYLNENAKRQYRRVLQALTPHMAEIVASFSPMNRISLSENVGEYAVTRDYNGKKRLYLIYFLRDTDGVWRLDSM